MRGFGVLGTGATVTRLFYYVMHFPAVIRWPHLFYRKRRENYTITEKAAATKVGVPFSLCSLAGCRHLHNRCAGHASPSSTQHKVYRHTIYSIRCAVYGMQYVAYVGIFFSSFTEKNPKIPRDKKFWKSVDTRNAEFRSCRNDDHTSDLECFGLKWT